MDKSYTMSIDFKSKITDDGIKRLKEWTQAYLAACPIPMEIENCEVVEKEYKIKDLDKQSKENN